MKRQKRNIETALEIAKYVIGAIALFAYGYGMILAAFYIGDMIK